MSTIELKERLIGKIHDTDDQALLAEAYRLLDLPAENDEVFKLNQEQKQAIALAQKQIRDGQFLTDHQAEKEIEEWLNK